MPAIAAALASGCSNIQRCRRSSTPSPNGLARLWLGPGHETVDGHGHVTCDLRHVPRSEPPARSRHARAVASRSDLEPRLLEVELALDAAHDLARDLAAVAQPDQRLALGGVDLVHHPLVEQRALLEPVLVLDLARADLEAPLAELVEPADPLDGAVAGPVLAPRARRPVRARRGRSPAGRGAPRSPPRCRPRRRRGGGSATAASGPVPPR